MDEGDKIEVIYGDNGITYELVENWANIPNGWDLIEVPALAVDSRDRVYAFTRSEHPVVVFDRDGDFLHSWGEGMFIRPHHLIVGPDDTLYCVDDFAHRLLKCTPEGRVLMTIEAPAGRPSETGYVPEDFLSVKHAGPPFNLPTSVALSPHGEIYVTDGYGNCRVHKFSPDGDLLLSWGEPGSGPGQFRLVHGICVDRDGTVYVGDRMNSRVQLFSPQGEFITQWNDVYQPNDMSIGHDGRMYIAEIGYRADLPMPGPVPAPGDSYSRVTIRDLKGGILSKITRSDPRAPGGFLSAHGARIDSRGDLYVGEVSATRAKNQGDNRHEFNILQKFARITG